MIADGERAKILEKTKEKLRYLGPTFHLPQCEQDKGHHNPGIASQGAGGGQHSFSPREEFGVFEKHHFAKEIGAFLSKHHEHYEEQLFIVPPKVLGDLRSEMHKNAAAKIIGEIQKITFIPRYQRLSIQSVLKKESFLIISGGSFSYIKYNSINRL